MELIVIILIISLLAVLVFAVKIYGKSAKSGEQIAILSTSLENERKFAAQQKNTIEELQKQNTLNQQKITNLEAERARLVEKVTNIESDRKRLEEETRNQFKVLAQEIMAENSKSFAEKSGKDLLNVLQPLKENIDSFKTLVVNTTTLEAKQHGILEDAIKQLMAANSSIGKEARDLANALRGNSKVQGDWGEMILESILQKSGLKEGENYFVQMTKNDDGQSLRSDDNRLLRPDVVVSLPDKKYIVVDSKVSLTAYANYMNAETDEEREMYGKQHVQSVFSHIKELTSKNYQDYVGVDKSGHLDFQLMFIPNEHAYLVAMTLGKTLWQDAYDQRVVIISPAHVMSTLRLIAQLWTRDKQDKNAMKIVEESGKLYDKIYGFYEDMKGIEKAITNAQTAYQSATNKLFEGKGNVLNRLNIMKTLGAKTSKQLPSGD